VAVIRLEGLSVFGHHGASLAERKAGTRLDVDVLLDIDTARAEASDQLSDTVSYDVIEALVRKVVEAESFRLLEALAARVAETCLRKCHATRATVRLTKRNLAWPTGGQVSVEISRTRAARFAKRPRAGRTARR
jgi:dihydroneopterin aldolase